MRNAQAGLLLSLRLAHRARPVFAFGRQPFLREPVDSRPGSFDRYDRSACADTLPVPVRHPPGFVEPCLPTIGQAMPCGPGSGAASAHREREGHTLSEHLDGNGALAFQHVCRMGLEGIVSKRVDAPYRRGPSKTWLKSKNPASEAVRREREEKWR